METDRRACCDDYHIRHSTHPHRSTANQPHESRATGKSNCGVRRWPAPKDAVAQDAELKVATVVQTCADTQKLWLYPPCECFVEKGTEQGDDDRLCDSSRRIHHFLVVTYFTYDIHRERHQDRYKKSSKPCCPYERVQIGAPCHHAKPPIKSRQHEKDSQCDNERMPPQIFTAKNRESIRYKSARKALEHSRSVLCQYKKLSRRGHTDRGGGFGPRSSMGTLGSQKL